MVFGGAKKVITNDTIIGSRSIEYLRKTDEILKSTSKRFVFTSVSLTIDHLPIMKRD